MSFMFSGRYTPHLWPLWPGHGGQKGLRHPVQVTRWRPPRWKNIGALLLKLATRASVLQKNTLGRNCIFMYILGIKNFHRWKHFVRQHDVLAGFFPILGDSTCRQRISSLEKMPARHPGKIWPTHRENLDGKKCSPRHLDRVCWGIFP